MGAEKTGVLVNEAESEALVALVRCTNVIDAYDPASAREHMSYDYVGRSGTITFKRVLTHLIEFYQEWKGPLHSNKSLVEH